MKRVIKAYVDTGVYIKEKLPLESQTLKSISYIDPELVSSSSTEVMQNLLKLPVIFVSVLKGDEGDQYSSEIRQLMNDTILPSYLDEKGMEVDCLNWWQSIESKYPVTFKMVSAVLSIFHGPRVESSYSMMTDIIDSKSGRMNIETYDALQTVKYSLMANQSTTSTDKPLAVTMFHREDKLTSPVNPTLARNMRSAYEAYNDVTTAKRKLSFFALKATLPCLRGSRRGKGEVIDNGREDIGFALDELGL